MSRTDSIWPSMEAHSKPLLEQKPATFTAVNTYLQTPEEPSVDSFSQEEQTQKPSQGWQLPPIVQTASPPASPLPLPSIACATGFTRDAPLFPETQSERRRSQSPLFEREPSPSGPQTASVSVQAAEPPVSQPQPHQSPTQTIRSPWTGISLPQEALQYYQSCVDQLRKVPRVGARLPAPTKSRSPERDAISQQQVSRLARNSGVTKPRPQPRTMVSRPKASIATSPIRATPPPRRRTPKAKTLSEFHNEAFPTQQSKHKRAAPSKKIADSGVHWRELPDYSPSTSDLDASGKQLKVFWDAQWLDISQDADFHELHSQEQNIASALRLHCDKYLYNKRKIFMARLQAIKDGKNFTKTAAQGACGIDVNKASKLWETFERVGWFEEHHFKQFL